MAAAGLGHGHDLDPLGRAQSDDGLGVVSNALAVYVDAYGTDLLSLSSKRVIQRRPPS
jgi:hypothetical protein